MHLNRIAIATLALFATAGCGRHRHGHGAAASSSGDEATPYSGPVSVENRSQFAVCSISSMGGARAAFEAPVTLPPGGTATFEANNTFRIQFSECGTGRLLYGDPFAWINNQETFPGGHLQATRIVLLDPGSTPTGEADAFTVELAPRDSSEVLRHAFIATMAHNVDDGRPFIQDAGLASELLTMLQRGAQAQGWHERFEAVVVSVPDWTNVQDNRGGMSITIAHDLQFVGGARWPNGACTVQSFGARQPFDGYNAQGVIGFNGIGDQLVIPCTLLDEMTRFPSAASGR